MKYQHMLIAASAAVAMAFALPASAATNPAATASARGRVIVLDPLAFLKVENLNFGDYLIPTSGSGTVTMNPIDAGLSFAGDITPLPTSTPQRGWLVGAGSPGQDVDVTAVLPVKLYIDGDNSKPSIDVTLTLDHLPNSSGVYRYTINTSKTFNIYIGGSLTISAGQQSGSYENAFEVTASYL